MRTTTRPTDRARKVVENRAHCHPGRSAAFSEKFQGAPIRDYCSLECLVAEYARRGRMIGGERGA